MEEKDKLSQTVEESLVALMYIEALFNAFEEANVPLPMGDYKLVYDMLKDLTDTVDLLAL